jgi:hypothetical protein
MEEYVLPRDRKHTNGENKTEKCFFRKKKQINLDKGTKERKTLKNITDR